MYPRVLSVNNHSMSHTTPYSIRTMTKSPSVSIVDDLGDDLDDVENVGAGSENLVINAMTTKRDDFVGFKSHGGGTSPARRAVMNLQSIMAKRNDNESVRRDSIGGQHDGSTRRDGNVGFVGKQLHVANRRNSIGERFDESIKRDGNVGSIGVRNEESINRDEDLTSIYGDGNLASINRFGNVGSNGMKYDDSLDRDGNVKSTHEVQYNAEIKDHDENFTSLSKQSNTMTNQPTNKLALIKTTTPMRVFQSTSSNNRLSVTKVVTTPKYAPPQAFQERKPLNSSATPLFTSFHYQEIERIRNLLLDTNASWMRAREGLLQAERILNKSTGRAQDDAQTLSRLGPAIAVHVKSVRSQLALAACECVDAACEALSANESFNKFAQEILGSAMLLSSSMSCKTAMDAGVRCLRVLFLADVTLSVDLVFDFASNSRNTLARRACSTLVLDLAVARSNSLEVSESRDSSLGQVVAKYLVDPDPATKACARRALAALACYREKDWVLRQINRVDFLHVKQFALEFPAAAAVLGLEPYSRQIVVVPAKSSTALHEPVVVLAHEFSVPSTKSPQNIAPLDNSSFMGDALRARKMDHSIKEKLTAALIAEETAASILAEQAIFANNSPQGQGLLAKKIENRILQRCTAAATTAVPFILETGMDETSPIGEALVRRKRERFLGNGNDVIDESSMVGAKALEFHRLYGGSGSPKSASSPTAHVFMSASSCLDDALLAKKMVLHNKSKLPSTLVRRTSDRRVVFDLGVSQDEVIPVVFCVPPPALAVQFPLIIEYEITPVFTKLSRSRNMFKWICLTFMVLVFVFKLVSKTDYLLRSILEVIKVVAVLNDDFYGESGYASSDFSLQVMNVQQKQQYEEEDTKGFVDALVTLAMGKEIEQPSPSVLEIEIAVEAETVEATAIKKTRVKKVFKVEPAIAAVEEVVLVPAIIAQTEENVNAASKPIVSVVKEVPSAAQVTVQVNVEENFIVDLNLVVSTAVKKFPLAVPVAIQVQVEESVVVASELVVAAGLEQIALIPITVTSELAAVAVEQTASVAITVALSPPAAVVTENAVFTPAAVQHEKSVVMITSGPTTVDVEEIRSASLINFIEIAPSSLESAVKAEHPPAPTESIATTSLSPISSVNDAVTHLLSVPLVMLLVAFVLFGRNMAAVQPDKDFEVIAEDDSIEISPPKGRFEATEVIQEPFHVTRVLRSRRVVPKEELVITKDGDAIITPHRRRGSMLSKR